MSLKRRDSFENIYQYFQEYCLTNNNSINPECPKELSNLVPLSLSNKRKNHKNNRPPLTYKQIIDIMYLKKKKRYVKLKDIYNFVENKLIYYKKTNTKGRNSSIRTCLSKFYSKKK